MKVALVLKGDIRAVAQFHNAFRELRDALPGFEFTLLESRSPGHALALAREACGDTDYLIAVGGDGTVNEVLNGAMTAGGKVPTLGILAYGTANDLVRTLGLQGDVTELIGLLAQDARQWVDVGNLQYRDADGEAHQRWFLNAADVGIGAEVVRHLANRRHFIGSNLHYLRSIVGSLRSYRHRNLHIRTDRGLDWQGRSLALVAGNGRYFGAGLCVAPGARMDDGELFVTLVGNATTWDFMRNLGRLKRGRLLEHPEASYHQACHISVEHEGDAARVEADGELLGFTPVEIDIRPRAVELLMPEPA